MRSNIRAGHTARAARQAQKSTESGVRSPLAALCERPNIAAQLRERPRASSVHFPGICQKKKIMPCDPCEQVHKRLVKPTLYRLLLRGLCEYSPVTTVCTLQTAIRNGRPLVAKWLLAPKRPPTAGAMLRGISGLSERSVFPRACFLAPQLRTVWPGAARASGLRLARWRPKAHSKHLDGG